MISVIGLGRSTISVDDSCDKIVMKVTTHEKQSVGFSVELDPVKAVQLGEALLAAACPSPTFVPKSYPAFRGLVE